MWHSRVFNAVVPLAWLAMSDRISPTFYGRLEASFTFSL
ncbi:Unknown protein sequence [Pseudomonas amygdali pv. myricae]|nr:Unknown protein sequence [Pseudomonas amygdali pv. myricae]